MNQETLINFFNKYIKDTPEKAVVLDQKMFLCRLTVAVQKGIGLSESIRGVYVTLRCIKHLFDKKPAEEFMFLLGNLHKVVKHPNKIYENKNSKRGGYCFVKRIGDAEYFCSIGVVKIPTTVFGEAVFGVSKFGAEKEVEEIQVATAFRLRDHKYLKNYTFLLDWGNGNPHRSALDTPKESTNAPQ